MSHRVTVEQRDSSQWERTAAGSWVGWADGDVRLIVNSLAIHVITTRDVASVHLTDNADFDAVPSLEPSAFYAKLIAADRAVAATVNSSVSRIADALESIGMKVSPPPSFRSQPGMLGAVQSVFELVIWPGGHPTSIQLFINFDEQLNLVFTMRLWKGDNSGYEFKTFKPGQTSAAVRFILKMTGGAIDD